MIMIRSALILALCKRSLATDQRRWSADEQGSSLRFAHRRLTNELDDAEHDRYIPDVELSTTVNPDDLELDGANKNKIEGTLTPESEPSLKYDTTTSSDTKSEGPRVFDMLNEIAAERREKNLLTTQTTSTVMTPWLLGALLLSLVLVV